jgi:xanthine dehydrogenase accessory factor
MTVSACLQSGTRADVAWLVDADGLPVSNWSDAVVFTPGGGRTGSVLAGALDPKLADFAGRWSVGRIVEIEVTQVDALIAELPGPGSARCLHMPAATLPVELWDLAANRERICLVVELSGDEVQGTRLYSQETIAEAGPEVVDLFERGSSGSTVSADWVVSLFVAVPQLVVVGAGPVAGALSELAGWLGWRTRIADEPALVSGLIAPLSALDKVVVAAHDLELAGAALAAALDSECGYIGSLGSRKMQGDRADWLAYRGVTDLSRVRGPAGLDIGASTPEEIAIAIVAEAIAAGATQR